MKKPTETQLNLLRHMNEALRCFHKQGVTGWYFWTTKSSFHLSTPTANACIKNNWIEQKEDSRYYISSLGKTFLK